MSLPSGNPVGECTPKDAWDGLELDHTAALVDVRTRAEWSFVGIPDLSTLGRTVILTEWRQYPDMAVNDTFAQSLMSEFSGEIPDRIYFICRSGARSMEAAHLVASAFGQSGLEVSCVNVAEGFEGDLDANGHRGQSNGWKAHGLPWRQN